MNNDRLVITSRKYTGDTSVISSRLPSDMIRELDKIAEKTKRNRNEIVAICLEYALENLTINDDNASHRWRCGSRTSYDSAFQSRVWLRQGCLRRGRAARIHLPIARSDDSEPQTEAYCKAPIAWIPLRQRSSRRSCLRQQRGQGAYFRRTGFAQSH